MTVRRCTDTFTDLGGVTHPCGRVEGHTGRHQCGWPVTCTASGPR